MTTALNPFVAGGAIGDPGGQGFFGRTKIFDFVRSALNSVQRPPILLIGQRRIGKSSVLRQLPGNLSPDYRCVYFDLQGKDAMVLDDVLYGLARAISEVVKTDRPLREQATEANFDRILEAAFAKLEGHPERLVLLFDEFDVVDLPPGAARDLAVNRFIPYIAELIVRHPQLGCIFVVGRKTEELSGRINSFLVKDSVQCTIGRLDPSEIEKLIAKSTEGVLAFEDNAVRRVIEIAAGHPYCTQVLCHVIWDRALRAPAPGAVIAADVDASVAEALDLGANGMNWIFDGLTDPVHRLVLSAVAQQMDIANPAPASRSDIDTALRKRSAMLEAAEIDRAVRELRSWDILAEAGNGFAIAVPLIGLWIKDRRPLERLEREVRFANPRAWKFYELALDSRERGDLDETIEELRLALKANPSFAEAQRALGSALLQRARRGELAETIENLERAYDLDPGGPTTELLEALSRGITTTANLETVKARFRRIDDLDPNGIYRQRAERALSERAQKLNESDDLADSFKAAELYELLGNSVAAGLARVQAKRSSPFWGICLLLSWAVVLGAGFVARADLVPWLKVLGAIAGGLALLVSVFQQKRKPIGPGRIMLTVGIVFGAVFWTYQQGGNWPAYVSGLALVTLGGSAAPTPVNSGPFPEDDRRSTLSPVSRLRLAGEILWGNSASRGSQKKDE